MFVLLWEKIITILLNPSSLSYNSLTLQILLLLIATPFILCILALFTVDEGNNKDFHDSISCSKKGNFFAVLIFLILRIPHIIWIIITFIFYILYVGTTNVAKFIKNIVILIHSEERLLCGVDAAIGSAIGYFTGNVFIGTLVGGIFGVANYVIVSKRILKLRQ